MAAGGPAPDEDDAPRLVEALRARLAESEARLARAEEMLRQAEARGEDLDAEVKRLRLEDRFVQMPNVQAALRDAITAEKAIDAFAVSAAVGYAVEVSPGAIGLNRTTRNRGDAGAINDMLVSSANLQFGYRDMRVRQRTEFHGHAGTTQLMRSAAEGRARNVHQLIYAGAPRTGAPDSAGYTALHWAAEKGHAAVISALFEHVHTEQPNIDALTQDHYTPLMLAASNGHSDAVKELLARGADQVIARRNGYTALHLAALSTLAEAPTVVRYLCSGARGRDAITKRTQHLETPLRLADNRGVAGAACAAVLRDFGGER